MAVQLESFDQVNAVIKECMATGLVTDWFLFNPEAIRVAPPLTISIEEIKKAASTLLNAIEKVCK